MTSGLPGLLVDDLGTAIVRGDHPPGSVLLTEDIARDAGVSRPVAREALRVLESLSLVTSRRRVGIIVRPPAEWNVLHPLVIRWRLDSAERPRQLRTLGELRCGVEPVAAALAAACADAGQAAELAERAARMAAAARARDLETFLVHDIAFHRLVLTASGNEMFTHLGDMVAEVLSGRTRHRMMPPEPAPSAVRWHAEVASAIGMGDADGAEAAMRRIVVRALDEIRFT